MKSAKSFLCGLVKAFEENDFVASKEIEDLVRKFKRNHRDYTSKRYNETQARQEFINPFFEALGWDIYNKQCFPEAYKEVLHEPSIIQSPFTDGGQ